MTFLIPSRLKQLRLLASLCFETDYTTTAVLQCFARLGSPALRHRQGLPLLHGSLGHTDLHRSRLAVYHDPMDINVKEEAQRLIASLPENSTWDDVMQEIYVRQAIERGRRSEQSQHFYVGSRCIRGSGCRTS